MSELDDFISEIESVIARDENGLNIESSRNIVSRINDFLYVSHNKLGKTIIDGIEMEYFSEFHKYWSEHYVEILDLKIDSEQCKSVAIALHDVFVRTRGKAFISLNNKYIVPGITKKESCLIRFLTANQDFRGSLDFDKLSQIYKSDRSIFDLSLVEADPEKFLKELKITDKSQVEKRIPFTTKLCEYLRSLESEPFDLISKYNNDVYCFREDLTNGRGKGTGYGNKKTDMFIRDMVVSKIWENVTNFDKIDVASDINTVKVSLRTGILTSAIPLVSSFIDICSYQYSEVDRMNALAWRRVWEIWREMYPSESIESPCLIDYFIYDVIGKQFCKEILYEYKCTECDHTFVWASPRNKTCQVCYLENKRKIKAEKIGKYMPCMHAEGCVAIRATSFVESDIAKPNYTSCPFIEICSVNNTQKLQPPKSISIMGNTGWKSSYAYEGQGGGGPMA